MKEVLPTISEDGRLNMMDLDTLLEVALGDIEETEDGFKWKGNTFPLVSVRNRHSVNVWRRFLAQLYDRPECNVLHLAVYHTALSVSCTGYHNLVLRRRVADTLIVEYNPHCLEALKSNMSIRLILHTPQQVFDYITKGSCIESGAQQMITKKLLELDENGVRDAGKLAERTQKMREVCQSEAYFRIDKQLRMSESNVKVAWIDSRFPNLRASTFVAVDDGEGITLPHRTGEYVRTSRIDDKYQKRYELLLNLILL